MRVCKLSARILMAAVVILLLSSTASNSAEKQRSIWTASDKAYHADEKTVAFVRPGLNLSLLSATISPDGTIQATVRLADPMGLPLDKDGVFTPGPVVLRWAAAYIPAGQSHFRAYTTRTQTSPITGVSAVQASNDSGGTYEKLSDGEYRYTFRTRAPSGFEASAMHRVSVSASRDLNFWELGVNLAEATLDFVPDGSAGAVTRDIVRTETCNKCHQGLQLHGTTGRTTVEGCIVCHQPQSVDPDTGNTVDFTAMVHKIHMGASLPSVRAGKPYQIIGFGQSVHDYSDVAHPADVRRCQSCHDPNSGAAQHENWLTNPTRAACGSCHDNINWATGENHLGLPQPSDRLCAGCHIPEGEIEFDASIKGAHTVPTESKELPGTIAELIEVSNGTAGEKPTVVFTLKDKAGNPILASRMDRLVLSLAGPAKDYPMTPIQEDARQADGAGDGRYWWTFKSAIPADATGTWAISVESHLEITLQPGTLNEMLVRDASANPVIYFSVDGAPVEPRREIVSLDKCNACHANLLLHTGRRKTVEYCVMCHRPGANDQKGRPADQMPPESIDFRAMIHRIHAASTLERDYIIYGGSGKAYNYSHLRYPGKLNKCEGCHVGNSYQVPLPKGLLNVSDSRGWLNPVGPETAACVSCHSNIQASSHALANTTDLLGESCAACHGAGKIASVDKSHAQ